MHSIFVLARLALLAVLVIASPAHAFQVAVFSNDTYTDVAEEDARLIASLVAQGHTVRTFSGITAGDFQNATAAANLLVFPEFDNSALFPDLSTEARDAIAAYVNGGGSVVNFDRTSNTTDFLNGIFGFTLVAQNPASPTNLNATAAMGTAFEGGPATLPNSDATDGFMTSSLPAGALDIYNDGAGSTTLFVAPVGEGHVAWFGFDWFQDPTPTEWEQVLGRGVTELGKLPAADNYACYSAKDLKNPKFVPVDSLPVEDQFGTGTLDVTKPFQVCTPTNADGSGIVQPDTHLCCYKSKGTKLSPPAEVETQDTFGTLELQLKAPKVFCTPCTKSVLPAAP